MSNSCSVQQNRACCTAAKFSPVRASASINPTSTQFAFLFTITTINASNASSVDLAIQHNNNGGGEETSEDSPVLVSAYSASVSLHSAYSYRRVSWFDNPDYDEPQPDMESYFSENTDYYDEDDYDLGYEPHQDTFNLDFQTLWDQAVEDFIFLQRAEEIEAELSDLSDD